MMTTADVESLTATLELKIESLLTAKQPAIASPEWHEHIAGQVSSRIASTLAALAASDDDDFYISDRHEIAKLKSAPEGNVTAVLQALVILTGSSQEYEDGTVNVSWAAVLNLLQAADSPRGLAGLLGALQDELTCSDASWHQVRQLLAQTGFDASSKFDGSSSVINLLASWVLLTVAKHDLVIGHALALREAEAASNEEKTPADGDHASTKDEEEARVKQRECAARVLRACEEDCKQSIGPLVSAAASYRELVAMEVEAAKPALEAASRGMQSLNKAALGEIKRLSNPPAEVKLVLEALCVLLGVAPDKVPATPQGMIGREFIGPELAHSLAGRQMEKRVDDYFGAAKRLISEPTFFDSMLAYDKEHVDPKVMARLRRDYIDAHPCFAEATPFWIMGKSSACAGLCWWLRGLEQYDRIINQLRPKRELLARVEAVLAEARTLLPANLTDDHAETLATTRSHDDEAASMTSDWSVLSEWSVLSSSIPAGMRPQGGDGGDDDARSECSWSEASAAAFEALDTLNGKDIAELKSLKQPPQIIKAVFDAVQLVLGVGGKRPDWATALPLLSDTRFFAKVTAFDPESISPKVLRRLRMYMANPLLNPEKVGEISKACKSLAIWLHAVYTYRSATIRTYSAPPPSRSGGAALQVVAEDSEVGHEPAAANGLKTPHPNALTELKSLRRPPAGVDSVTAAVLILLGHEGIPSWEAAKQLLVSPVAFVERLKAFDASSDEGRARIERARPLLEGAHVTTKAMRGKSSAAAGLAEWAHAVVSGEAAAATSGRTAAGVATTHVEDATAAAVARKAATAAPTAWRLGEVRAASDANKKAELLDAHLKAAAQAAAKALPSRLAALQASACASAEEAAAVEALAKMHDVQASRWRAAAELPTELEARGETAAALPTAVMPPPYATMDGDDWPCGGGTEPILPAYDSMHTGLSKRTPLGNYFRGASPADDAEAVAFACAPPSARTREAQRLTMGATVLIDRQLTGGVNSLAFAPVPPPTTARVAALVAFVNKPVAPCDVNARPFSLKRCELTDAKVGGSKGAEELPVTVIVTSPDELRAGVVSKETDYDGVVDNGCAWTVMPANCLGTELPMADDECVRTWSEGLRAGAELTKPFYDGVVNSLEPAWGMQLPSDAIANDEATAKQLATAKARIARWGGDGTASEGWRAKRCAALARYFRNRAGPIAEQGGESAKGPWHARTAVEPNRHQTAGCTPPGAAFFTPCLKVARVEDAPANLARHAAEEAAAYEAKALDGSWLTVFPIDGKWPKESKWAELHGVAHGEGGFAFASSRALKRVSARLNMPRRMHATCWSSRATATAREQNRRAAKRTAKRAAAVDVSEAVDDSQKATVEGKEAVAKEAAAATKRFLVSIKKDEGVDGAYDGDGRPKGEHGSPNSVMMGGGGLPDYVAPDLNSLAQVAKSIEALLTKAKPRARALASSSRRAL